MLEQNQVECAQSVRTLLVRLIPEEYLHDDIAPTVLAKTPARVVNALMECLQGYNVDIRRLLHTDFRCAYKHRTLSANGDIQVVKSTPAQPICVKDIQFYSLCEHHLLPFFGTVDIAYRPDIENGKVVGISKLARVVKALSQRLQLQERLTDQIAGSIFNYLNASGVYVRVRAQHLCMQMRGIQAQNAITITSASYGDSVVVKGLEQLVCTT